MKFSIIIPCRDDQAGLNRSAQSVLDQTYGDLELIVVDDGSEVPVSVPQDPRVIVLTNERPLGPAAARNRGLAAATGDVVGWCDSDDYFAPDRLVFAVEMHERADVAVVGQSDVVQLRSSSDVARSLATVLHSFTPHLGATTIRRDLCERLDERFLACEDVEWWVRTSCAGLSYEADERVGYVVGDDARERILNSPAARLDFSYALLELHDDFYSADKRAAAFRWRRISVMERREGNMSLAFRAWRRSLSTHPTIGTIAEASRLLPSLASAGLPPPLIAERPLAPLVALRAKELSALRRGTVESRQTFRPTLQVAVAGSAALPRSVRGRIRRATTMGLGDPIVEAATAWGTMPLGPDEVRLLAPYADEPIEMALLARYLQPAMNVIDVGANRGFYALMFAARVGPKGSVVAVEPDPRMVERLELMGRWNAVQDILSIEPSALGSRRGSVPFVFETEPALNHVASLGASTESSAVSAVTGITYRDLLERHRLTRIDLMKIDVEGLEPDVLFDVIRSDPYSLPSLIMFEHEPTHWARAGSGSLASVASAMDELYELRAVDYLTGSLVQITSASVPSWAGRNVMALRRGDVGEGVARMVFSTTT